MPTVDHEAGQRRPRVPHRTHNTAAVAITLPEHEAEERLDYLDQYSCRPPPLVLIALSLSQVRSLCGLRTLISHSRLVCSYTRQFSCLKRVRLWGQMDQYTFR